MSENICLFDQKSKVIYDFDDMTAGHKNHLVNSRETFGSGLDPKKLFYRQTG